MTNPFEASHILTEVSDEPEKTENVEFNVLSKIW